MNNLCFVDLCANNLLQISEHDSVYLWHTPREPPLPQDQVVVDSDTESSEPDVPLASIRTQIAPVSSRINHISILVHYS